MKPKKNKTETISLADLSILKKDLSKYIPKYKSVLVNKFVSDRCYRVICVDNSLDNRIIKVSATLDYNITLISYNYLYERLLWQFESEIEVLRDYIIIKDQDMQLDMLYMRISNLSSKKDLITSEEKAKLLKKRRINCAIDILEANDNIYNRMILINNLIESLLLTNHADKKFDLSCHQTYSLIESIINDRTNEELCKLKKEISQKTISDYQTEVAVFFEYNDTYNAFIKNIFIKLCQPLKAKLYYSSVVIHKQFSHKGYDGVVIAFKFHDKYLKAESLLMLQRYLYWKTPELKLQYIDIIPYPLNTEINTPIEHIFQCITEDLLQMNTLDPISESKAVTLYIYFYIIASRIFYPNKKELIKKNQLLFESFLKISISHFSIQLLSTADFYSYKTKISNEYDFIYSKIEENIVLNYKSVLDGEHIDFNDFKYLLTLTDNLKEYDSLKKEELFNSFISHSMDLFFLPNYYKAFIPFVILKYYDQEI